MTGTILGDIGPRGYAIAISGLLIVFTALVLISLFIASLPRILEYLAKYFPEVDESHVRQPPSDGDVADDGAVLAAIGYVLHTELQRQLAEEKDRSGNG